MPNSNTNWKNSQPVHPDKVRSALGNSTLLHSFLLPQGQPQQPQGAAPQPGQPQGQTPQPQPEQESPKEEKKEDVKTEMTEMELNLTKQIDGLRKEMQDNQKMEMENLKAMITSALSEEDNDEKPKA